MFGPRSPSTITRSEEDLPIVTVERITIAPVLFAWNKDEKNSASASDSASESDSASSSDSASVSDSTSASDSASESDSASSSDSASESLGGAFGSSGTSVQDQGAERREGGKRGRRPGRKALLEKQDMKAKLERSRQSARECRARKKLRYQYLEELVADRERSVLSLRKELEKVSLTLFANTYISLTTLTGDDLPGATVSAVNLSTEDPGSIAGRGNLGFFFIFEFSLVWSG
ncbi:jg23958 [Pararge aegeria aegeria]|uniref:Jg23958 protein n=1 Tax=Pararge aegeria aegeria TaxID=348720 RepID=A0A8S4RCT0_9NEOP|nr:jg23958 [Pararge aegeria aegeria]